MTGPRMRMPHPGLDAWEAARLLFGVEHPSRDQCLTAVDLAAVLRAEGRLPAAGRRPVVVYPERPGAGVCLCSGRVQDRTEERIRDLFGTVPA